MVPGFRCAACGLQLLRSPWMAEVRRTVGWGECNESQPEVRQMKILIALAIALLILGCSASDDPQSLLKNEITVHLKSTNYKSIDFKEIDGPQWTRVCFFGPYSGGSGEVLGFPWKIENMTDALASDGHNAIVFATDKEVISFVVLSRSGADFWKLSRRCFQRNDSQFVQDPESGTWKNYVRRPKA